MVQTMPRDGKLELCLLLLRLSIGAFFLIWSIDKIVAADHAQRVFSKFYFLTITPEIAMGIGVAQTTIVALFIIGALKLLSYGALLVMHTVSVGSTVPRLLVPYQETTNLLFWGAVPVVFALLMLFLLRDRDRLLSVS